MTWAVYLNETPLDSIGIWVEDISARFHGVQRTYPTIALPGRQGVVLAAEPETSARLLTISGTIDPAARTLTARSTAEDRLKALAYGALIKVITDDDETAPRQIDGVCEDVRITPVVHPMVTQLSRFQLTVKCPDPTWYDVTGQLIGFNATPSPVPLGTAPSGGLIRVAAPSWSANVTNPVVVYRNAAGVTLQTLGFTLTLVAGNDYLEIDLDRQTIVEYQSGVVRNAIGDLTSGEFFALDPMDGDPFSASYPSLALTSSGGTPAGQWLGPRRWL
jgi:hypothetical protein